MLIMISMVRALSKNNQLQSLRNRNVIDDDEENQSSFWSFEWVNKYVLLPYKYYMLIWNFFVLTFNLITLLFVSYEEGFRLVTVGDGEPTFLFWMDIIICIDIILTFFKAYPPQLKAVGFWLIVFRKIKICPTRSRKI